MWGPIDGNIGIIWHIIIPTLIIDYRLNVKKEIEYVAQSNEISQVLSSWRLEQYCIKLVEFKLFFPQHKVLFNYREWDIGALS